MEERFKTLNEKLLNDKQSLSRDIKKLQRKYNNSKQLWMKLRGKKKTGTVCSLFWIFGYFLNFAFPNSSTNPYEITSCLKFWAIFVLKICKKLFPLLCFTQIKRFRSSHPGVLFEKGVLKMCSKFTGEHHVEVWFP